MTPLALLALLGIALFIPAFTNGDDDETTVEPDQPDEPEEPVTPQEPATPVDPAAPVDLVDPTEPETPTDEGARVLNGTSDDDNLRATAQMPFVNGNEGNDTLQSGVNGVDARLNGGAGDDLIETEILVGFPDMTLEPQILTGGTGSDTFIIDLDVTSVSSASVDFPLVTIPDFQAGIDTLELRVAAFPSAAQDFVGVTQEIAQDGSFTDLIARYTDPTGTEPDLTATVRLEGIAGLGEDQFIVEDGRDVIAGTDGNDTLSSTGNDDGLSGLDTLRGLAGDDVLIHAASDSSDPIVLEGGAGNDTLIANEVEFGQQTTLDGGAGDDVLRSDNFLPRGGGAFDTFITGEGADRIEITTFNVGSSSSIALGLIGVVTDFTPGEDMIFVDPSQLVREVFPQDGANGGEDFIAEYDQEFTLREDPGGAFTDLEFTFTYMGGTEEGEPVQMTGTLRLEGLTGITEDDIAFAQLETQAPLFTRDGISSSP